MTVHSANITIILPGQRLMFLEDTNGRGVVLLPFLLCRIF